MSDATETPTTEKTPSEAGQDPTTAKTSEQPLTSEPDFAALGSVNLQVTPGVSAVPDTVGGLDAEEKRGRGRPAMSAEEKEAARERKRQADRERRKNKAGKAIEKKDPDAPEIDKKLEIAKVNAQMISGVLTALAKGISNGEYTPSEQQEAATQGAWTVYLHAEGVDLPPWVQVCIVSVLHVMPAFATSHGKATLGGTWAKAKLWWKAWRG